MRLGLHCFPFNSAIASVVLSTATIVHGAPSVDSPLHIEDFGPRDDGGKILSLVSKDLRRAELRVEDKDGNVTLRREVNGASQIGLSPEGKFAFVATYFPADSPPPNEFGQEQRAPGGPPSALPPPRIELAPNRMPRFNFEVFDAHGNTAWKGFLPFPGSHRISDAGLVLQFPGSGGGALTLWDQRGRATKLTPNETSNRWISHAWSSDGLALLVVFEDRAKARCYRGTTLAYEHDFSGTPGRARVNVAGVWNDCTALLTLESLSRADAVETLLLISPRGEAAVQRSLEHRTTEQRAAISPDGKAFAYVDRDNVVRVHERENARAVKTHSIPSQDPVAKILIGDESDKLTLLCAAPAPWNPRSGAINRSGHWLRFLHRGKLHDIVIPVGEKEVRAVRLNRRGHVLVPFEAGIREISPPK